MSHVKRKDNWSAADIAFLKEEYNKRSATELSKILGRTRSAVIGRAYRLGLCTKKVTSVSPRAKGRKTPTLRKF